MITNLFFELIRYSLGTRTELSRLPSEAEWAQLYDMAEKQCLVGICFAGVQRLGNYDEEDYAGMPEVLYLTWMGMAAQIQQANHVVNRQCVVLQRMLAEAGFPSCILKGQAVARYYATVEDKRLSMLRQSGDIDAWVDGSREAVVAYANSVSPGEKAGNQHVTFHVFNDTEVELHYVPSVLSGRRQNALLQAWFEQQKPLQMNNLLHRMTVATTSFNLVYLLVHIFRHYFAEGIGLRQLMDYYYVLKAADQDDVQAAVPVIRELGFEGFASAIMWVLGHVFEGLDPALADRADWMPWTPDAAKGRRLLDIVLEGGNFGHSTEKFKITGWDQPLHRLVRYVRRNSLILRDYPDAVLSGLLSKFRYFLHPEQ